MITIPPCYYDKKLLKMIDEQVECGFLSFSALDETEQELIAAQCMEILGDDAYSCIIEGSQNDNLASSIIKFMRTAKPEHSYDVMAAINKNITEYFTDVLNILFCERYEEIEIDRRMNFKRSYKDLNTGEIVCA